MTVTFAGQTQTAAADADGRWVTRSHISMDRNAKRLDSGLLGPVALQMTR